MNENGLSPLQFGHVHQSLPWRQGAHRYRRWFHDAESLGLHSHFPFFDRDIIRPTAAKSWVTVNCIAHFEFCDVRSRLLYDAGDVVAGNQWQMCAEFARVFAAERERVCRIDAARNHPNKSFVFIRLWPWDLFEF